MLSLVSSFLSTQVKCFNAEDYEVSCFQENILKYQVRLFNECRLFNPAHPHHVIPSCSSVSGRAQRLWLY